VKGKRERREERFRMQMDGLNILERECLSWLRGQIVFKMSN
jgi:hypothetical protein